MNVFGGNQNDVFNKTLKREILQLKQRDIDSHDGFYTNEYDERGRKRGVKQKSDLIARGATHKAGKMKFDYRQSCKRPRKETKANKQYQIASIIFISRVQFCKGHRIALFFVAK